MYLNFVDRLPFLNFSTGRMCMRILIRVWCQIMLSTGIPHYLLEMEVGRMMIDVSTNALNDNNIKLLMGAINPHSPSRLNSPEPQLQPHSTSQVQASKKKYVMELRDRDIIIDYRRKIKLTIGDIMGFPAGGYEGLHLWDTHVVLARFIVANPHLWNNNDVIQLLSGTGIASIAMQKFASARKIVATDRTEEVLQNVVKNTQKNNMTCSNFTLCCIPWPASNLQFKEKFDCVIGADLLFQGCPINFLISLLAKLLKVQGKAYIIAPKYAGQRQHQDSSREFVDSLSSELFSLKKEKLSDALYSESPLLNQVQGFEQFPVIGEGNFFVYTLQKLQEKEGQEYIPQAQAMTGKTRKLESRAIRMETTLKNEDLQIKENFVEEREIRKQLQVLKVNASQDKPEYTRKKSKTISDLIAESQQENNKPKAREKEDRRSGQEEMQEKEKKKEIEKENQIKNYEVMEEEKEKKETNFEKKAQIKQQNLKEK